MPDFHKVLATGLNFRVGPATDEEVIAVLPRNHVVDVLFVDHQSGWSLVRTQVHLTHMEGFVASRLIGPLNEKPAVAGELTVTADKLRRLAPNARDSIVVPLDDTADAVLAEFDINENSRRLTHFLAQIAHECGGFRRIEENLNYSAQRLREVWPSRFPTAAVANRYARKPEKIANRAYANRIGNGPESSGDGWRYRGRGLIQLTGRANYDKFGGLAGIDLENNPDRAREPDTALRVAAAYWDSKNLNAQADLNRITAITRAINGGLNGLEDRRAYHERARAIWG